jgi:hypothetical protein
MQQTVEARPGMKSIPAVLLAQPIDVAAALMVPRRHPQCYDLDCEICAARERRAAERRAARAKAAGCRCGQRNCDCAKWDAIYEAKFEDPEYYSRDRQPPSSTPTADIVPKDLRGCNLVKRHDL